MVLVSCFCHAVVGETGVQEGTKYPPLRGPSVEDQRGRRVVATPYHLGAARLNNEFRRYVHDNSIPIHKLVAITTDGTPEMRGLHSGFVALCRGDPDFPRVFQRSLCDPSALTSKAVDSSHVMALAVMIVNSISAKGLQHRLFKSLLVEFDVNAMLMMLRQMLMRV